VGRNPPKNLSTSLKSTSLRDYLKKSDPVKLAKSRERVRQERAIERFVPTAEEEVQKIVQEITDTTGEYPSEAQVEDIEDKVLQERRKRGVQAGSKRGPYLGKLEGQDIDKTMAQKKLIKGIKALFANVDRSKFNRAFREQQAQAQALQSSPLLREMIAQQFPQSSSQISLQLPSPTDSGAVFDSLTGQLVELRHPQTDA
jgi:hypothetical protein